jgi:hypothetical protein
VLRVVHDSGFASMVSTLPFGSSVKPSSPLPSALPAPVVVHVRVDASRIASSFVPEYPEAPSMNLPSARTTPGASPMRDQLPAPPFGGPTDVHVLVSGS